MKRQNIIRINVIVIAVVAALYFTTSVQAQETENSEWNDGPNVAIANGSHSSTAPDSLPPVNEVNSSNSDTLVISSSALTSAPILARGNSLSQWTPTQLWMLNSLLFCIAVLAVYALAEARRANRMLNSRLASINAKPTLP